MKKYSLIIWFAAYFLGIYAQQISKKEEYRYADPIIADTDSSLLIPLFYNYEVMSNHKIAYWNDYYANIIVYNFIEDSFKNVFDSDTYILTFMASLSRDICTIEQRIKYITENHLFYLVKYYDSNNNGRIDSKDPVTLFASDKQGNNLKVLTGDSESVNGFYMYEEQGFALLKIQPLNNKKITSGPEENETYFIKLNLKDLSLGNRIN